MESKFTMRLAFSTNLESFYAIRRLTTSFNLNDTFTFSVLLRISFTKREMDLVLVSRESRAAECVIELKFPHNGQYPEQMFSFCRDIAFIEELKRAGIRQAGLLILVDDPLFYSGRCDGIYGFFRCGNVLTGTIQKPTGSRNEEVTISGQYVIHWTEATAPLRYAFVDVP
jgi:hypothetical protein